MSDKDNPMKPQRKFEFESEHCGKKLPPWLVANFSLVKNKVMAKVPKLVR
jgi:hypothetical protein